ncbi:MAG TPA: thioredoxin domain-containing protein [Candidatus Saccharimonadales bacterium]|jgi:protein-disulfide isomerase
MDKRFLGLLVVIALVLTGIFFISNNKTAEAPSGPKGGLTDHIQGTASANVKLVEYGDFQCPACGRYHIPVKEVVEKYGSLISFQFRNFPLFSIHPNAIAGARAAEAADLQGKYWEMHDKLYEENYAQQIAQSQGKNYSTWLDASNPQSNFDNYASGLGLDLTKFRQDYKSKTTNDRVQADLREATRLGVDSTPTFYLNGKKISTPSPTLEAFSKVIDAEIVKKGGTPPPATAPAASTAPAAETTPAPAE